MKQIITIQGGFHNVGTLRIRAEVRVEPWGRVALISEGQSHKIDKHLCPCKACVCVGRGAEIRDADNNSCTLTIKD